MQGCKEVCYERAVQTEPNNQLQNQFASNSLTVSYAEDTDPYQNGHKLQYA